MSILISAATGGLGLLTQLYLKDLGASPLIISLVTSLGAVGVLLGSLFWGAVSDRRTRKPLLVIVAASIGSMIGVLATLPSPAIVLPAVFAMTFMRIGFVAITMAIVSGVSLEHRRARNLSYLTSARSLGFALGSASTGFVLEALGFRVGFVIMTLLPLCGLVFLVFLPPEPGPVVLRRQSSLRLASQTGLTDLYLGTILRQMAIDGSFSLLFVYMAILGISPGAMGLVSSINTGAQVGALLLFGRLADRIGRRRIFLLGFALSALVPCILVLAANLWGMALAYLMVGFSFSSLYIGSTAHIGDRIPKEHQGTMLGLYESTRGLGGIIGPIIAGAITPVVGYNGMFLTMAGIAGMGFVLMLVHKKDTPRLTGELG